MDETYLGVIKALGFKFTPRNWAYCGGGLLSISQFNALFSLLGCEYGGDCRVSFGLPDLRGRLPMGQFTGAGLTTRVLGQRCGIPGGHLPTSMMPTHTHTVSYGGSGGGGATPTIRAAADPAKLQTPAAGDVLASPANNFGALQDNRYIAPADATDTVEVKGFEVTEGGEFMNAFLTINPSGTAAKEIDLTQPSQVINFCICIYGLYPARS